MMAEDANLECRRESDGRDSMDNFDSKVAATLSHVEELLNENVEGKDSKLKLVFDTLHKMEEKYVSSRLTTVKKDHQYATDPVSDFVSTEYDSECDNTGEWRKAYDKGLKNKTFKNVVKINEKFGSNKNRKYTLNESESDSESM